MPKRHRLTPSLIKFASLLDAKRAEYLDALNNDHVLMGNGMSALLSENFSEGAHKTHKRNLIRAGVSGATTLLVGAGAGEIAHHVVVASSTAATR
jgi:hypothetical protein